MGTGLREKRVLECIVGLIFIGLQDSKVLVYAIVLGAG
jgi:hypothetical protein